MFWIGFIALGLLSLAVHESAHAWTADRYGDPTARRLGRVTLNPIKHLDVFWSLLMPLSLYLGSGGRFLFGGGKPVPVNVFQLRNFQLHQLYVAMAGPLSNVALTALFLALSWVYVVFFGSDNDVNFWILMNAALLNYILAVFNALPLPPLDGFSILIFFADRATAERWSLHKGMGSIFLIILLLSGLLGYILRMAMIPFFVIFAGLFQIGL